MLELILVLVLDYRCYDLVLLQGKVVLRSMSSGQAKCFDMLSPVNINTFVIGEDSGGHGMLHSH
jgi:hypothetical protein